MKSTAPGRAILPLILIALASGRAGGTQENPNVRDLIARSVANNDANWKAAPQFTFREHDVITKNGRTISRTYEVMMIDGSPYQKLLAADGKQLDQAAMQKEERKLQQEKQRRDRESAEARRRRIAEYQREREQDHALMREMVNAFNFQWKAKEIMNARECFLIEASPRPGYVPKDRQTKVLAGMRGRLWIDTAAYQWVKVQAAVVRPVAFGLFIAHVRPGTEFTLEEMPVQGNIWLPVHFETRVKASIMFWSHNSIDDESYSHYQRAQ